MREIKFRLWHTETKVMYATDLRWGSPTQHGGGWLRAVPFGEERSATFFSNGNEVQVDPHGCEIMQFTGLYDRNGTEIYEGDVLRMTYKVARRYDDTLDEFPIIVQISFHGGGFWFTGDGYTDCNWHFYNESEREVIGNIYEHPELLEKESMTEVLGANTSG